MNADMQQPVRVFSVQLHTMQLLCCMDVCTAHCVRLQGQQFHHE